jgi:Raf kinase inhibitor-like YbhB/YbcL family protein
VIENPRLAQPAGGCTEQSIQKTSMKLSSPHFSDGNNIPERFTCEGDDCNPTLVIEDVPQAAKSLVLIVDDPDAPRGTFTHWLIWNLRSDVTEITEGSAPPSGVQGLNDFGTGKYGGPCPPSGVHRYYFRLYALDMTLELAPNSKRNAVEAAMESHVIAEAILMGRYARKRRP